MDHYFITLVSRNDKLNIFLINPKTIMILNLIRTGVCVSHKLLSKIIRSKNIVPRQQVKNILSHVSFFLTLNRFSNLFFPYKQNNRLSVLMRVSQNATVRKYTQRAIAKSKERKKNCLTNCYSSSFSNGGSVQMCAEARRGRVAPAHQLQPQNSSARWAINRCLRNERGASGGGAGGDGRNRAAA